MMPDTVIRKMTESEFSQAGVKPLANERQIIVMIQGALTVLFHYWLVLEDASPSNNPTSSTRVIIPAIFPFACKV